MAAGTLALAGLGAVNASSASAEVRTATAGSLQWGIKTSLMNYHFNHLGTTQTTTPGDGATASSSTRSSGPAANPNAQTYPEFWNFPFESGSYDTTTNQYTAQYGGYVELKDTNPDESTGPSGASPFKYFKFGKPRVVLNFTTGVKELYVEVTPGNDVGAPAPTGPAVDTKFGTLTVAGAAAPVGDVITYTNVPTALTAAGQAFFDDRYFEGEPLDPITSSLTAPPVGATPTPEPSSTPTPTPEPSTSPTPTPVPSSTPGGPVAPSGNPVYALTGSSFTWSLSDIFQFKGAGPCHGLSAGYVPNGSTTFSATAGNVSIVDSGGSALTAAACSASGSNVPISQNVKFSGGSGYIDPTTKAAVVSFTGSVSMLMNGGATPIRITNPVLKVNADGTGALTGALSSTNQNGSTYQGNNKTIAKFTGITLGTTGFTHTPDYLGKTIDLAGSPVPTVANQLGDWGAWAQDFVSFANLNGNAAFFYNTASAVQPPANSQSRKKTNPLTAVYGTQGASPLGGSTQTLLLSVLQGQQIGEFSWRILQNGTVNLADPTPVTGDKVQYTGALNPVEVTDARSAGTWSLSGSSGAFALIPATTPPTTLGAFFLGWTPVIVTGGANAVAGAAVEPGTAATQGLSTSRPLATGAYNGDPRTGVLGANLVMRIPGTTAPGDYRSTLTLTALAI